MVLAASSSQHIFANGSSISPFFHGASILHLPVELLAMIFTMIQSTRQSLSAIEELRLPTAFPHSAASVCRHWRSVMLENPRLWTRIAVFVGPSNPTPLSDLCTWLKASRDLPINVHVMRRPDDMQITPDSGEYERDRVCAVVDILKPHVLRCTSLSFQLLHRSSLPSLCDDIGALLKVRTLILTCQDGAPSPLDNPLLDEANYGWGRRLEPPLEFPELVYLEIDGPNFVKVSSFNFNWLKQQPRNETLSVKLSHLELSDAEIDWALKVLQEASCLFLSHMKLEDWVYNAQRQPAHILLRRLEVLYVENVDDEFLREVAYDAWMPQLQELGIQGCNARGFASYLFLPMRAQILRLEGIHDSHQLMWLFMGCWNGEALYLNDCLGFDDRLLDEMCNAITSHDTPGAAGPLFSLDQLEIVSCNNFSIASLKRFTHTVRGHRPFPLHLKVVGLPAPTKEDQTWLIDNTHSYIWES
ncbi:hypothetical protein Hypma_005882 [Hypsizygus marmoreus]|uniref:F-box domain-containing protein n=1 Tax=Hypsizygus marmoreus TaxID=39966 RepID=A0A369KDI7_HYPMA|nr:hypothetical protein Hypma_005882 [Hypsizygus marmoreus]